MRMNLVVSFVHPSNPSRTVGPFVAIRLDGETTLRARAERVCCVPSPRSRRLWPECSGCGRDKARRGCEPPPRWPDEGE
jgi:hypothetical protein